MIPAFAIMSPLCEIFFQTVVISIRSIAGNTYLPLCWPLFLIHTGWTCSFALFGARESETPKWRHSYTSITLREIQLKTLTDAYNRLRANPKFVRTVKAGPSSRDRGALSLRPATALEYLYQKLGVDIADATLHGLGSTEFYGSLPPPSPNDYWEFLSSDGGLRGDPAKRSVFLEHVRDLE